MTEQETQKTKEELKTLLDQLTAGDTSGAVISAQLDEIENGATALENELATAQTDIDAMVEESGKQIDALAAAEQQEA